MKLDPGGGVVGFMAWLTSTLRADDRVGLDAVQIVTFHAAKGLEWPMVHVAGLEEGFVPISHASDDDEIDEERRLLYVALTRARDELSCTLGPHPRVRVTQPPPKPVAVARGDRRGRGSEGAGADPSGAGPTGS